MAQRSLGRHKAIAEPSKVAAGNYTKHGKHCTKQHVRIAFAERIITTTTKTRTHVKFIVMGAYATVRRAINLHTYTRETKVGFAACGRRKEETRHTHTTKQHAQFGPVVAMRDKCNANKARALAQAQGQGIAAAVGRAGRVCYKNQPQGHRFTVIGR
ncbi:uncharacterized protein LOC133929264 [Phragmites australis]|uniref:uncharacterized protein LOC133929264 n=1 Tax=Phragmites australis TaxID=29695 RepID=UPI002D797B93|nr:uncharacterized protein LOC133929264 [Phragmites australis]